MSDLYYYGNQPMLRYKSGDIIRAAPVSQVTANKIEELEQKLNMAEVCIEEYSQKIKNHIESAESYEEQIEDLEDEVKTWKEWWYGGMGSHPPEVDDE